ncbi:MAG: indolepyruvate ferredoxin oxidoreductase subunit alpha [Eubacteriales bacterium]
MGNEAIAAGAVHVGVSLVAGYPGTPSTEILETAAKTAAGRFYVEWSVNEKAALEVAAGAAYSGARTLVTMKQVGLNVASDPLMSLAYVGVKGGMVIVSADDPGPISSQTEQDTRHFARFAKLPCFDPSSPEEAYEMVGAAYEVSEKYQTPVLLRPTTRVCHGCASVTVDDEYVPHTPEGFQKDTQRWVIFPRTSYLNHIRIEERVPTLSDEFSASPFNRMEGTGRIGIACGGISYAYVTEAIRILGVCDRVSVLKIGTPYPFPEKLAVGFIQSTDKILVAEELDPVIERELIFLCGKHNLPCKVYGKYTGNSPLAGENTVESVTKNLADFLGIERSEPAKADLPTLPVRPPVLCAGCPHRASFLAVKHAMRGKKAVFSGDIGCYTLGNAKPLDMVDTCLCMGADVTIAQGIHRIEPDTVNFSFIGDSTFFASGMTGVANAVYNDCDLVLMLLDNSITAMTGGQPHPGTGRTMMGTDGGKIDIVKVLEGLGVSHITVVNPFDFYETVNAVKEAAEKKGVKAVICRAPCVNLVKPEKAKTVNDRCVGCKKCIHETGCPALVVEGKKVTIESGLCTGCGLCAQVCPATAIE